MFRVTRARTLQMHRLIKKPILAKWKEVGRPVQDGGGFFRGTDFAGAGSDFLEIGRATPNTSTKEKKIRK